MATERRCLTCDTLFTPKPEAHQGCCPTCVKVYSEGNPLLQDLVEMPAPREMRFAPKTKLPSISYQKIEP